MRFSLLLFIFLAAKLLFAQRDPYPDAGFVPPVDFTMYLSGTFGELRSNHFHSGIDIKTQGVEGKKIYSIADGYVSRIKVSPTGFGKAVYITHPNGLSSVYAHLRGFNDEIKQYVRQEQYKRESFAINLFPEEGKLPVKQGDVIAYSGNSGGSMGPHLHFEIRETATEKPLNPLFFNFPVKDYVRPSINYLKIYPIDGGSGKESLKYTVDGWGLKHRLRGPDTIIHNGNIAFGIAVYDQLNDMPNRNGVYSVALYIDSLLISHHEMDRFSFAETRYINSLIDYSEYKENRIRFQRSEVDPNNQLSVYKTINNRGIYIPEDTLVHHVLYVVEDTYGNTSELSFYLQHKSDKLPTVKINSPPDKAQFFSWERENKYEVDDFKIVTPTGSFYRDFVFTYSTAPSSGNLFSEIHKVHENTFPVHRYVNIFIKPHDLPARLRDKALIAEVSESVSSAGGVWEDGFVRASIREFGNYAITVDTTAPEIIPLNIHNGKNIRGYQNIKIKIDDDLSGIDEYRAAINGKWILMEYDAKNNLLTYEIDEHLPKGNSEFTLMVRDNKENIAEYSVTLYY